MPGSWMGSVRGQAVPDCFECGRALHLRAGSFFFEFGYEFKDVFYQAKKLVLPVLIFGLFQM